MKNKKRPRRKEFKGEVAAPGIAIGKVHPVGTRSLSFSQYWINDSEVKTEIQRFHRSLKECKNQLDQIKSKLCTLEGRDQISILDSHILLLQDELLVRNTVATIEKEHINAEWALHKTMDEIKQAFAKINQTYLKERRYDIDYIENAILRNLLGKGKKLLNKVPAGSIIVAFDLSPADTLHLVRFKIGGFVIERGGLNSHTAIVARSLAIPTLMGVKDIYESIQEKDPIIVDGEMGRIIHHPRAIDLKNYSKKQESQRAEEKRIKKEAKLEAKTIDGTAIQILANVELPEEIGLLQSYRTDGVGLYRTEFLFLDREIPPDEKEQEDKYKIILKKMAPHEVTIRTIDLGADKLSKNMNYADEMNPALGLRAIRFCLRERKIFMEQLRALLKASAHGKLKICLPMISNITEFRKIKKIIRELIAEMKTKKVRLPDSIPLGVMIETPAAAMEIDLLAREADFFSVGTNDLIQYLLAVDRTNELVSYLYNPLHPSVIRILKHVVDTANKFGKEVTICGEMAGDPFYIPLLIALGFNRLSMNVASIPKVKKILRMTSLTEAQALLTKVLGSSSYTENQRILENRMKELFPQYFQ